MQRFRARSQILVNHLEDCDDVIHQTFSDDSPLHSDEEEVDGPGEDEQQPEDEETTSVLYLYTNLGNSIRHTKAFH